MPKEDAVINVCTECRERLPKKMNFPPNYDGGSTVVTAERQVLILKHCEICGKLLVITTKIEELAR